MFMSIWILLKERADTMANELTVIKKFDIAPIDDDILQSFKEEMDGLGTMPIDVIKIPSGGGIAFEVPGEDPESPDMAKELVGVIVAHRPQNAYWQDAYSGDNASPDCFSSDGKTGIDSSTGEAKSCDTCPFNQYGSAKNAQGQPTKGKACKNIHRLYLLQEGAMFPVVINLPPTSIKSFRDYIARRLLLKGKKPSNVVTKITLKKATSGDGITYSQCVFAKAGDLSKDMIASLAPAVALAKELMNMQPAIETTEEQEQPQPQEFNGRAVNAATVDIPQFETVD